MKPENENKSENQESVEDVNLGSFFKSSFKTIFSYAYDPSRNLKKMLGVHALGFAESAIKVVAPIWAFEKAQEANLFSSEEAYTPISNTTMLLGVTALASSFILPRLRGLLINSVRRDIQKEISVDMVRRVYDGPLDEHIAEPTGDLVATVSKNYAEIEKVMPIFEGILNLSFEMLLQSAVLYRYCGVAGLTPALVFLPYLVVAFGSELYTALLKLGNSDTMVKSFDQLLDTVNNYTVALQNGNRNYEIAKLDKQLSELEQSFEKVNNVEEKNALILSVLNRLGFLASSAYLLWQSSGSEVSQTEALSIFAFNMLASAMKIESLPPKINALINGIAGAYLIDKFYKTHPVIENPADPVELNLQSAPSIEFRNVNFSYGEDKPGLRNLNFTINPGSTVVIMGPSGCGKSSILKILQRFHDNYTGEILINGVNIKDIDLEKYRRNLASVSQDTGLLNDTIAANIGYGDPSASEEDIAKAAHFASLKLSDEQFSSQVQKGGANFSGGEKQRTLIARALLKGGAGHVLLADEITSALDQHTAKEILKVINDLGNDVTKIIVTHDPYMIKYADLIINMNAGEISECGSFNELIENTEGEFYKSYEKMCEKFGLEVDDIINERNEQLQAVALKDSNPEFSEWVTKRKHSYFFNEHQESDNNGVEDARDLYDSEAFSFKKTQ